MAESAFPAPLPNRAARRAAARRKAGAALSATALATTGGALAVAAAGPAVADTTFTVTGLGDDGSPGTLRWAIEQANTTPGSDTIDFDAAVTGTIELTDDLPTITEELAIVGPGSDVVTISGMDEWAIVGFVGAGTSSVSGLTLTRGEVGAGGSIHNDDYSGAALSVYGSDVTASALVVSASYAANDGGGLWCRSYETKDAVVAASLTITGSLVTGNEAGYAGGGIYARDCDLTVTDSVISGNIAHDGDGGGIYFSDSDASGVETLVLRSSTVSGNTAVDAAGVLVVNRQGGTSRVENSTISDNTGSGYGGGLLTVSFDGEGPGGATIVSNTTISGNSAVVGGAAFAPEGELQLVQSTVTLNTASGFVTGLAEFSTSGGGVAAGFYYSEGNAASKGRDTHGPRISGLPKGVAFEKGTVSLIGSIVAANVGGDLTGSDFTGLASVVGVIDSGTSFVDQGASQTGVTDPGLGPLQDNGGPTETHALLDGSPAIDAGPVPPPAFPFDADDQRGPGYSRVMNGRIDVGAVEVQNAAIEPNFTG